MNLSLGGQHFTLQDYPAHAAINRKTSLLDEAKFIDLQT
jgi:hypothetical protein